MVLDILIVLSLSIITTMLKGLSMLYTGLWYTLGILIYIGIYQESDMFLINFVVGSVFVLIGGFHTLKLLRYVEPPEDPRITSYKNLEIISLIIQSMFLVFLMVGVCYRVFSEGFPVFG